MKEIVTAVSLACLVSLALPNPASPEDRETGRPRGFGFVEMPNQGELVFLGCNSDPHLLTEDELGEAVTVFVARTGTRPAFVGFRPFLMPIEDVFRIDEGKLVLIDCSWRSVILLP